MVKFYPRQHLSYKKLKKGVVKPVIYMAGVGVISVISVILEMKS